VVGFFSSPYQPDDVEEQLHLMPEYKSMVQQIPQV
jgi:hypothetical protein